jgi:hypothetical protein
MRYWHFFEPKASSKIYGAYAREKLRFALSANRWREGNDTLFVASPYS